MIQELIVIAPYIAYAGTSKNDSKSLFDKLSLGRPNLLCTDWI